MNLSLGAFWAFPCSLVFARGKIGRPKNCENDSSCGSSGLLGIRKCHKSQERGHLRKIPSPHFRLQGFRCILLCSRKTSKLLGHTSQPGSNSISSWFAHHPSYQECYLIHSLQLFLTGSSALLETACILADKPVNCGNSTGLLDFFLENVSEL